MPDKSPEEIIEYERALRDREAGTYDSGRPDWEVDVHRYAVLSQLGLQPGETLLDAGAGTGVYVLNYLAAGASGDTVGSATNVCARKMPAPPVIEVSSFGAFRSVISKTKKPVSPAP